MPKPAPNGPPKDPTVAYVYRERKKAFNAAPDWVDVGKAFEAGRRFERKQKR